MYLKFKRFLDIFFALFLLPFLFPIMVIISLAIKLDSKGPIFFIQARSGKNGKEFKMIKFRSMTNEKNNQVTKVGKIIRTTSLDEIPQLFNIIKGEMSFIGPRPWVVDCYEYFSENQKRRLDVLLGITGLAQVYGRKELKICDRINYDLYYVNNLSFLLDFQIFGLTIVNMLKHKESNAKTNVENEIEELRNQEKSENDTVLHLTTKQKKKNLLNQKINLLYSLRTQKSIEPLKHEIPFLEEEVCENNNLKRNKILKEEKNN